MDPLVIGSLTVEVKPNGLVKLSLTAMKDGVPTVFISQDSLQRILDFAQEQTEVEDLL